MTTHEAVKVVSFTGSTAVGRLGESARGLERSRRPISRWEGKNVVMIMDDAQLELAVEGCLWGGFGTTGQRCTAASRVVVHEQVYDEFLRQFTCARERTAGGKRTGRSNADGAVGQRVAARDRDEVRGDRPRRRRTAGHGRPSTDLRDRTRADGFTSRRSSATSIRRCESRRRRSSVPSCR